MRLSENVHLPFDRPFDKLTVLSKVEGLMALSKAEGPFNRFTALSYVEGSILSSVEASKGCVTLIPRHCGVLLCTPHSSGFVRASLGLPTLRAGPQFRKPCIWTFSISLSDAGFSAASMVIIISNILGRRIEVSK